jgi:uncharacterized GH25 family protein
MAVVLCPGKSATLNGTLARTQQEQDMNPTAKKRIVFIALAAAVLIGTVEAHDGWIQSNVSRVFQDDMVYIDMPFGNHGNTHRDFKIWGSKWDINRATFWLHTPEGDVLDLRESVIDLGMDETKSICGGTATYLDRNGFLATSFQAEQAGLYIMDVRQDVVVSYAPERSIKCTKVVVGSVPSVMGNYGASLAGFDKVLGQDLEIVPLDDPTGLKVGDAFAVLVLYKGSPLPDACLSVIPRGKVLPPFGEPTPYDLMTDMDGIAVFTFDEANYHLIVVHLETDESGSLDGKAYSFTKYTAALTVIVKPAKARPQKGGR